MACNIKKEAKYKTSYKILYTVPKEARPLAGGAVYSCMIDRSFLALSRDARELNLARGVLKQ